VFFDDNGSAGFVQILEKSEKSWILKWKFSRSGKSWKMTLGVFGSSSVKVGFGFVSGSSSMELERYFCGGHLLRINCSCKYQLID